MIGHWEDLVMSRVYRLHPPISSSDLRFLPLSTTSLVYFFITVKPLSILVSSIVTVLNDLWLTSDFISWEPWRFVPPQQQWVLSKGTWRWFRSTLSDRCNSFTSVLGSHPILFRVWKGECLSQFELILFSWVPGVHFCNFDPFVSSFYYDT